MVMMDPRQGNTGEHGDAAAYLLGALDAAGRARFEVHAAGCAECRAELAALQPVADDLGLSVEQVAPPAHVRQRLLTRAHLTPTQPLTPLPVPPPQPPAAAGWWAGAQRYSGLLAAASLVVALASGGMAVAAQRQLSDVTASAEYATAQLADTLTIVYQPNMIRRELAGMEAAPQASGKVVMAPDRNKAVVIAYGLPQIKQSESYQCWLTTQDDKRTDGGTFRPDTNGKAYWVLRVPEMLAKYRWMGVTKEAGKGAPQPQGPRILGGNLQ